MAPAGVDEVKTDMTEGVQKKCKSRQVFLQGQFGEGQDDRQLSAERSGQGRRYNHTKARKHVVRTGGMLESVEGDRLFESDGGCTGLAQWLCHFVSTSPS